MKGRSRRTLQSRKEFACQRFNIHAVQGGQRYGLKSWPENKLPSLHGTVKRKSASLRPYKHTVFIACL